MIADTRSDKDIAADSFQTGDQLFFQLCCNEHNYYLLRFNDGQKENVQLTLQKLEIRLIALKEGSSLTTAQLRVSQQTAKY